ncbi:hypothetical protein [Paraburkholderia sediminicola]|uniref:hypothetical protein n=1 Tax=Paraburkholderia sediminicola TaxID=458836 RepID=UPI0038BDFFE8
MKIVKGSIVASALVMGVAAAAYGQSVGQPGNTGVAGMNGVQSSGINNMGAAAGAGLGTGAGTSPAPGVGTMGGAGAGPALNTMRANGTSLNMNPDPRVPNLAGKGMPPRN